MAAFSNLDYTFRYGTREELERSKVLNGSFNICYDTSEMYIDIVDKRLAISSIVIYDSENEIRSLTTYDANKVYFARDTYNLLYYDIDTLAWKLCVGEHVKYSDKAERDADGNKISEYYETAENATFEYNNLNDLIANLTNIVSNINSFDIIIVDSIDDLPAEGETNVMYFAPEESEEDTDEDTIYAEYVWLENDGGYYEKIGITRPDLQDYYKKTEIDNTVSNINTSITNLQTSLTNEATARSTKDNELATGISAAISHADDLRAASKSSIDTINGYISTSTYSNAQTIEERLDSIEAGTAGVATESMVEESISDYNLNTALWSTTVDEDGNIVSVTTDYGSED